MALFYGGAGIHVFPVNGKTPLTEHGFHDATIDPEQIERDIRFRRALGVIRHREPHVSSAVRRSP